MVANGDKGHLPTVQIVVQDLEGLQLLFWEPRLIHEHHAVDGEGHGGVALLAAQGTREHLADLIGGGVMRALVELLLQTLENVRPLEQALLGLQTPQVCEGDVEGDVGRSGGPDDDERSVSHRAGHHGKQVLLEGLGLGDPCREVDLLHEPIKFFVERLDEGKPSGQHVALVQLLLVPLPVLGIQSDVVDEGQCDQDGPGAVVMVISPWLALFVQPYQPVVKHKHPLDVTLTDTAPRTSGGFGLNVVLT